MVKDKYYPGYDPKIGLKYWRWAEWMYGQQAVDYRLQDMLDRAKVAKTKRKSIARILLV